MAVVAAYLWPVPSDGAASSGRLRTPTTTTGIPAPVSTAITLYGWTVPRDPSASDALPLSPGGGRLRSGGGVDIPPLTATGTLAVTLDALTLAATGTVLVTGTLTVTLDAVTLVANNGTTSTGRRRWLLVQQAGRRR